MDPTDRSRKQPDLAVYDAHSGGIFPTLVDAVVTDPTASTQPNSSETRVGAAAAARERTKRRKYHAMAASRHFIFRAFGIETFGAWGPEATAALGKWTQHATNTGQVEPASLTASIGITS